MGAPGAEGISSFMDLAAANNSSDGQRGVTGVYLDTCSKQRQARDCPMSCSRAAPNHPDPTFARSCLAHLTILLESDQVVGPLLEVPSLNVMDGSELGITRECDLQVGVIGEVLLGIECIR